VEIVDHYVTGTRLRVRCMRTGDDVVWKLGKKVRQRATSPEVVQLTNNYPSEQEYSVCIGSAASTLSKTRWRREFDGHRMAVDAFHGGLSGLVLAEVELCPDDERLGPPPVAVADVTENDRFSKGGTLAALDDRAAGAFVRAIAPDVDGRPSR